MNSATCFEDKSPSLGRYHKDKLWDISEYYSIVSRHLVGKPEGKRPLGKPRRRWEDKIKMDLKEVGCGGMDWTDLAEGRDSWRAVVSAVMRSFGFHKMWGFLN